MIYVLDEKNLQKYTALRRALKEVENASIFPIAVRGMPDVKPLSLKDAQDAATLGVDAVVREYLHRTEIDPIEATAVCFQKGIILGSASVPPFLICDIAVRRTNSQDASHVECERIALDHRITDLVMNGVKIYDALREIYGDDVADKKISLIEKVRPDLTEVAWMTAGVLQALC